MAKRSLLVRDPANLLALRVAVGAVFIMHGGRTIFIKGPSWFAATYLESTGVPYPLILAVIVPLVELAGGISLTIGFYPRVAALFLAGEMATAFFLVHMNKGFFLEEGGFEFAMVLFAACLVFLIGPPPKVLRM